MKFRDPETGEFKELYTKAADTLPVGTVVDYEGTEIPAGWEEAEATDDYSTEETFTGKYWIDGKKIYRKVLTYNTFNFVANTKIMHGVANFNRLINFNWSGYLGVSNKWYYHWDTLDNANITWDNEKLTIATPDYEYSWSDIVFIIEYTKTTD